MATLFGAKEVPGAALWNAVTISIKYSNPFYSNNLVETLLLVG